MKIPLEQEPFPPVSLTHNQELQLKWLSDALLDETLAENDDFVITQKRVLNRSKWKQVMSRENVTIYKRVGEGDLGGCTSDISLSEPGIQPRSIYWRVPCCIGVGTLPGTLDDMLYGLLAPTKASTDVRSTYMKDGIADSRVLVNLINPSEADPLRCLLLRWSLLYQLIHRVAVTPRDVVSMESIGSKVLPNGERVGYIVIQAVDVPGCGELSHLGLIRGKHSSGFVFRDTGKGSIEVFMRGFVEAGGKLSDSMSVFSACTTLISVWRLMYASQNKKLAFMVRSSLATTSKREMLAKAKDDGAKSCPICSKSFSALRSTHCNMCKQKVCNRCIEKRKIAHVMPSGDIAHVSMVICKGCLTTASGLDPRDVATSEYVDTASYAHRRGSQQSSTSSSSGPPDLSTWLNQTDQGIRHQSDTISSYSTIGDDSVKGDIVIRGSSLSEVSTSSVWTSSHSTDWVDHDAEALATVGQDVWEMFVRMNQLRVTAEETYILTARNTNAMLEAGRSSAPDAKQE